MLLPLWVILTFAILGLVIVGLLWRMKNCRCSLYETFESAEPAESEDAEQTKSAESEDAEQTKSAKLTESAEPEEDKTETEAEVKTKVPEKETVDDTPAMDGPTDKKDKTLEKKIADKFMNYSEMKIFDNLRDNAYSLQDIKRMIREGEITSQMIEKFLSRVEKMEDRVQGKKETMIEGFSGSKFASAYFN